MPEPRIPATPEQLLGHPRSYPDKSWSRSILLGHGSAVVRPSSAVLGQGLVATKISPHLGNMFFEAFRRTHRVHSSENQIRGRLPQIEAIIGPINWKTIVDQPQCIIIGHQLIDNHQNWSMIGICSSCSPTARWNVGPATPEQLLGHPRSSATTSAEYCSNDQNDVVLDEQYPRISFPARTAPISPQFHPFSIL